MTELKIAQAAEYIGIKESLLKSIIKNGRELHKHRSGRSFVLNQLDIDAWKEKKAERTVTLDKADFVKAFKFAIQKLIGEDNGQNKILYQCCSPR